MPEDTVQRLFKDAVSIRPNKICITLKPPEEIPKMASEFLAWNELGLQFKEPVTWTF